MSQSMNGSSSSLNRATSIESLSKVSSSTSDISKIAASNSSQISLANFHPLCFSKVHMPSLFFRLLSKAFCRMFLVPKNSTKMNLFLVCNLWRPIYLLPMSIICFLQSAASEFHWKVFWRIFKNFHLS